MDQTAHGPRALGIAPTAPEILQELWLEAARHDPALRPDAPGTAIVRNAAGGADSRFGLVPPPLTTLLALDGEAFIAAAYGAALGRLPDEAGAAAARAALARGFSKVAVLGSLSRSPEGRAAGRTIQGLSARAAMHAVYRLPLIGMMARGGAAVMRRSGLSRRLAAMAEMRRGFGPLRQDYDAKIAALAARFDAAETAHARQEQVEADALDTQRGLLESLTRKIAASQDDQLRVLGRLADRLDAVGRQLASVQAPLRAPLEGLSDAIEALRQDAAKAKAEVEAWRVEALLHATPEEGRLSQRVGQAEAAIAGLLADATAQQRRIFLGMEEMKRTGAGPEAAMPQEEEEHSLDSLYIAFEDVFRGTREDIHRRQRVYLPDLAAAGAGTPARPIVDVACGRGEFLELLRDEGLSASGVDLNAAMAAFGRSLGLDVTSGDAIAYLARLPGGALGAVTGFHVIEHLPYRAMVRLLDESLRVLAPGGIVIFETPNPNNLLVASRYFYLDPTHRNPLPAEMVAMIAGARGFTDVAIRELHPMSQRFMAEDVKLGEQLDALFHGCRDYALIARKP